MNAMPFSATSPEVCPMEIELELGGFYRCLQEGLEPVTIWIGRVDLPMDLGTGASEPVVSLMIKSPDEGMPTISHAPFWESSALDGEMTEGEPFDVSEEQFAEHYNIWRSAYDAEEAQPWGMTPNEVYGQLIAELVAEMKGAVDEGENE